MNTTFVKTKKIKTFEDWERDAAPKGKDKQWKKGRSAWCMADFAMNHNANFQRIIANILKECNIELQDFKCEPEAIASLGKGMKNGGQRNHDLLMVGTKNCIIGIEAKVSEKFDNPFPIELRKQAKKKEKETETRAFALKSFLTPEENVDEIGYQLFTATRGSMISAMKSGYRNAIVLIIVFEGDIQLNKDETKKSYEETIKKNDEDFCKFLCAIKADENGMIKREIEGKTINCWIKKIKINVPDYSRVE